MKSAITAVMIFLCALTGYFSSIAPSDAPYVPRTLQYQHSEDESGLDNDWFMTRRAYPRNEIPPGAAELMRRDMGQFLSRAWKDGKSRTSSAAWTLAGPSNIGGRIAAVEVDPSNPDIIYAGSASGGVWKSTDFGGTWSVIFNQAYSIGALALDPGNASTLYVGTGEANPGGVACYPGNGIWRSTDAGTTWTNLGLTLTGHIGRIAIDPSNTNRLFVAALGLYRGKTPDRGVYRSTDGGSSWSNVLFLNDTTGAIDLVIDPANSSNVLAAMWLRYRTPAKSDLQGGASGLYRSTDAGTTWSVVTSGFPSGSSTLGRVSLTFAPSNPSVVYALAASGAGWGGIYRSSTSGASWTQTFANSSFGEGQVWFNNIITVHPANPDLLWAGMTSLYQSTNGGPNTNYASFGGDFHVDQHAMQYAPSDPNKIVLGNDGGIFTSTNAGSNWLKSYNLPVTQFYAGTIDFQNPNRLLGGTQDNNTIKMDDGGVATWYPILGGDGFVPLVDPTDSNYVYAESQNGGLAYSTDGGNSFFGGTNGINSSDRKNWQTPIAMNLQNPKTLFTGTQYVYRTRTHMQSWTQISGDLTYGNGGRVGTISTIDVAPTDSNVVYVGTDDGRVWVSTNGGSLWIEIGTSLPDRWVTRVTVDPVDPAIAYVTFSGFIVYDFGGHIYRTTNFGATWTDIGSGLPDIPINDVVIDPADRSRLFIANDLNVMWTTNLGTSWDILGTGFPEVAVHDLAIHPPTRMLVAFTHGRSAYKTPMPPPGGPSVITVAVRNRWNIVSVPMVVEDSSVSAVFPTAVSPAYAYEGLSGYLISPDLSTKRGYWMKFTSAQDVFIEGLPVLQETVDVAAGWNLIGSVYQSAGSNILYSIPPGLISSPVYGYDGSYFEAPAIVPGKGYWVKTSGSGKIVIPGDAFGSSARSEVASPDRSGHALIEFRTDQGNSQVLSLARETEPIALSTKFELPPRPPQGAFDVRFSSGKSAGFLGGKEEAEFQISLSSPDAPVIVEVKASMFLRSMTLFVDGRPFPLGAGTPATVPPGVRDVRLHVAGAEIPARFDLSQNYPNPFNPSTTVRYDLPVDARVALQVYDIGGRLVATLFRGHQSAGSHEVRWDASGMAGGIYFSRLVATSSDGSKQSYVQTRKMILAK